MRDFQYHRPASLGDAIAALRAASDGRFLAGGQSLLPVMKLDLSAPSDLVSLGGIAGLSAITREGDQLTIGAMATHADVAGSQVVRDAIPALAELAGQIGDPQVRHRGTLGGSVAHNDPAADYPAALVGLNATVITDRREIAADDFFGTMFATALEDDEIITAVRFAIPEAAAYAKFPTPASRYAMVGVMVARTADETRVAVTGAATGVFRVAAMEAALIDSFTSAAIEGIGPGDVELLSDLDASAEYRAHLVGVMARRAVAACG
jgi:carbon-monoxide dehydrogenase medium subunit